MLVVACIFNAFGVAVMSILGSTMLESVKGVDATTTLLVIMGSNAVAVFGYLFFGWLGDRIGRRPAIIIGWALAAVICIWG